MKHIPLRGSPAITIKGTVYEPHVGVAVNARRTGVLLQLQDYNYEQTRVIMTKQDVNDLIKLLRQEMKKIA